MARVVLFHRGMRSSAPARGWRIVAALVLAAAAMVACADPAAQADELVSAATLVHGFGGAPELGSPARPSSDPIVGMAQTPDGGGYWLASATGGVYAYGTAAFAGSLGGSHLNAPIVGISATPSGHGYWLVASDGGVFAFGDARFFGSTGAIRLNKPIVGMAATADGLGYWLVASDGGVFAFGSAPFLGSLGAIRLNKPIVGMARTTSGLGRGYWLVASDGGVFAFGDAAFYGSLGAIRLNQPIMAMAASLTGRGYWLVGADGGVFAFGDAPFAGSAAGRGLQSIAIGIAAHTGGGYWVLEASSCSLLGADVGDKASGAGTMADLTAVVLSTTSCSERVTFTFRAPLDSTTAPVASWEAGYRDAPFTDTAGFIEPAVGPAYLQVRFFPASTVDMTSNPAVTTYTGPNPVVPATPVAVREARLIDDFEAVMVWVISVDHPRPYRVLTLSNPTRVVVEFASTGQASLLPTVAAPVYLMSGDQLRAVPRTILADAPVRRAVQMLLAGPSLAEYRAGITTTIPDGSTLRGVTMNGTTAVIDLSASFASGGGTFSTVARLAELVYTVTGLPGVSAVTLRLEGRPVTVFGSEGYIISHPLTRADFLSFAPV